MRSNVYDVYDTEGKKIVESKTNKEIADILGVSATRVTKCAWAGQMLKNQYKIEKIGEINSEPSEDDAAKLYILREWDKIRAPFLKVIWVKEDGCGVKKLWSKRVG